MRASQSRSFLQRHFAWLLWLALLVPVAQGAAAMHALSHAPDELAGFARLHGPHAIAAEQPVAEPAGDGPPGVGAADDLAIA